MRTREDKRMVKLYIFLFLVKTAFSGQMLKKDQHVHFLVIPLGRHAVYT